ncbi:glycosyltransferase family 2 protein [Paludibaculum fermentans]|uniref:Glycosyltransferase n=1 Tax=Paludibaculum fermentans TaxID=1473598 RepID=A0A7S7NWJ1_PALFE|nr:glycosyltransferase [Paludibaculum fermentans]QOY91113.1 glycosyltransferase [Paludibaculum fermentans]
MDFSVVITTWNRPDSLAQCLDALAAQVYPPEAFEVVVVDDGSPTPLDERAVQRSGRNVRLVRQVNSGPAAGRNLGAQAACGEWLAFTDDDCRPRPGWLAAMKRVLGTHPGALVGGVTINALKTNAYSQASQSILDAAYRYFNPDPENARFFATDNLVVARERFLACGGLDVRFRVASEDREFCERWLAGGGRIVTAEDAVVDHFHALTFRTFCRQHFQYGRGAAQFHRGRLGRLRRDVSFRWRVHDWLVRPVRESPNPVLAAGLVAAWQLANTAGFFWESLRLPYRDPRPMSPTNLRN